MKRTGGTCFSLVSSDLYFNALLTVTVYVKSMANDRVENLSLSLSNTW
jgi:hypothetical protein